MMARLPPWFESLDPDIAEMLADYLMSEEALDVIVPKLDAMSIAMFVPYDRRFTGRMNEFVEEHTSECIRVAYQAMIEGFSVLIEELRSTRDKSEIAEKMEEEE